MPTLFSSRPIDILKEHTALQKRMRARAIEFKKALKKLKENGNNHKKTIAMRSN